MTDRDARAKTTNSTFRRLRWKKEHTDDLPQKRPRYRRDEKPDWRSFECADIDEPLP